MKRDELAKRLESMKGLAGSGNVLSEVIKRNPFEMLVTMEPGDIVRTKTDSVAAAPVACDLWYLQYHQNFLQKYYDAGEGDNSGAFDYAPYLSNQLSFLNVLPELRPLKVYTDLEAQFTVNELRFESVWSMKEKYESGGVYWINAVFFELIVNRNAPLRYPSEGPDGFRNNPNDYAGYIAFPIGQLGVMEVISLFQETELNGYVFSNYSGNPGYHEKAPLAQVEEKDKPAVQSPQNLFPVMKDENGNALAGLNYCFGRHLIESAYYKPETPVPSQNGLNSVGATSHAPVAARDVELWAGDIKDYGEDIRPKLWMRYWIHRDSTLPVPGEFIGILCRPVACPPHVCWFQESAPLLYAGNWMETNHFTSGVITSVTLEKQRPAGSAGNEYRVKIQGVEITACATDYFLYAPGDRVAVLKTTSLGAAVKTFCSLEQTHFKESDGEIISAIHVIIPATFYKLKH